MIDHGLGSPSHVFGYCASRHPLRRCPRNRRDAVNNGPQVEGHELVSRRLGGLAMGLYASRAYLDRAPLDSTDHKLITVMEDQAHLPEAKWLKAAFPQANVAFRSNSREVQFAATMAGVGIAALAQYSASKTQDLVPLHPDASPLERDIWLGVHSDMRHMPRIRAVVDTIIAAFAQDWAQN